MLPERAPLASGCDVGNVGRVCDIAVNEGGSEFEAVGLGIVGVGHRSAALSCSFVRKNHGGAERGWRVAEPGKDNRGKRDEAERTVPLWLIPFTVFNLGEIILEHGTNDKYAFIDRCLAKQFHHLIVSC